MADASAKVTLAPGRVRTRPLIQMEAVECGAACLGIVLDHFGRIVPLPELRRACGVSRDGTRASNLLAAAKYYGLDAKALHKEPHELGDQRYPFIVLWNFKHFVVVEGARGDVVFLNDPATGPRTVTRAEFEAAYNGVALPMTPGTGFARGGRRPSVLRGIWVRLRKSKGAVALCALTAFLLVIPGLGTAALIRAFIDNVVVARLDDWARPVILGLLIAALARALLSAIELRLLRGLRTRLAAAMSGKFVWHLLHLPAAFYAQRYSGEIASRVALNDRAADALSGPIAATALDLPMAVFYAIAMFATDTVLTAVAVALAIVHFTVLRVIMGTRMTVIQRLMQDQSRLASETLAGLSGIRTIKASALEDDLFARLCTRYAALANWQQRLTMANLSLNVLPRFVAALMTLAVLGVGGLRVMNGALSIGMLIAFLTLATGFLAPVSRLLALSPALQDLQGDLSRLDDVLENPAEEPSRTESPTGAIRLDGRLEVERLTFGYNPAVPPLVENLSFRAEPGQRIALVGASGSGKSTVAKLIAGIYPATSGTILFDGLTREAVGRDTLTNSLAMVDQDVQLFAGSVRDNLTLWDPTVPDAELVRACRDACIHDDIVALPHGYATELLESASNLSGGQRQRIEIARALCANPSLLILDEATSALDPETERIIDENLRRRSCTCLVIAHRLSTVRDADEIIVLERGRVVERGTHDQLMTARNAYFRLAATDEEADDGRQRAS